MSYDDRCPITEDEAIDGHYMSWTLFWSQYSLRELAKDLIHTLQYVGDWKLLSLLGTGGMSDVYLAQHTARPATYCALKLTKDYILDHKHLKSDACYQSIVSEWQSFETIRTNEDPKATDTTQMPVGWGQDPVEPTHPPCNATKLKKESAGSLQARIVGKAKGGLPAAYGYGFVKVGSAQHYHGWIAMQLLGWNLHSIATDKKKPLTWSTFYRVSILLKAWTESLRSAHHWSWPEWLSLGLISWWHTCTNTAVYRNSIVIAVQYCNTWVLDSWSAVRGSQPCSTNTSS